MYIAIEGIDYVGKSTQVEALKKIYPEAIFTIEPGGTEIGEKIRDIVLYEKMDRLARMFLFLADRAEHAAKVLIPNKGKMIISDRSLISGVAYAYKSADWQLLMAINRLAVYEVKPDLCIILKIEDEQTLLKRMITKKPDEVEKEGLLYLLEVQDEIIEAASSLEIPCETIDAALPQSDITERIKELIDDYSA
ncbi:MAG: dTMP kinase [Helicobacteraceae bacterium]|jgi:dTMP kinase|nr:dTMP kinase [Helicobacteraceae bacterium]